MWDKFCKLWMIVVQIILTILVTPLVYVAWFIRPWVWIRFGYIYIDRIGHFAFDVEHYLCEQEARSKRRKTHDFFFVKGKSANHQLLKMSKRSLTITPISRIYYGAFKYTPFGTKHSVIPARERTGSRDLTGLFSETECHLSFSGSENLEARRIIRENGCDRLDSIVCFVVRDHAYLEKYHFGRDWSYHNFRDTNIDDYALAAKTLADKGYWVFRMGKSVAEEFRVNHRRIIDYACSSFRSDLLDVWLMANCAFGVSTGVGLDSISDVFRRPMVYINYLPLIDMVSWNNNITVPKSLRWKKKREFLTIEEYLDQDFLSGEDYKNADIEVINLSPPEILDAVLEMEGRLRGTWSSGPEDDHLQEVFRERIRKHPNYSKYHGSFHPDARVGTSFLQQVGGDLDRQCQIN